MEPNTHTHTTRSHLFCLWPHQFTPFLTRTHLFSCSACLSFRVFFYFGSVWLPTVQMTALPFKHTHARTQQHTWCPVFLSGRQSLSLDSIPAPSGEPVSVNNGTILKANTHTPLRAHQKGKHRGSCSALRQPRQNILTGWCLLVLPAARAGWLWGLCFCPSCVCDLGNSAILGKNWLLLLRGGNDDDDDDGDNVPNKAGRLRWPGPPPALLTAHTCWSDSPEMINGWNRCIFLISQPD